MNILFIHQNFPGQFKHLAPALAKQGHKVVALTCRFKERKQWQGVDILPYPIQKRHRTSENPLLIDFETKLIRAESCSRSALQLKQTGFEPDVIIAHPGWGESLFLKHVWPNARLGIFCELFYETSDETNYFDKELQEKPSIYAMSRLDIKNTSNHLHFAMADSGLSPTQYQHQTFPLPFRDKISVIHDGIDTNDVRPDSDAVLDLQGFPKFSRNDEIITFVNRNLEPMRGYHVFMRALPKLLKNRPNAQILIVGGDSVSYSKARDDNKSWKQVMIDEVRPDISDDDWARVHFLGRIKYPDFKILLQISSLHIYLTYPFVLSWSLLEAMSTECAIIASNTAPVREVIKHDETGRLVDFFDQDAITSEISQLLDDPQTRTRLGQAARQHVVDHYDLMTKCLPKQLEWVHALYAKDANPQDAADAPGS
ncbi:glycosyltransferase [Parasulfitobacter algicola]|uniref:Glycosyltransferase n=1 Tax=Parasulfitobacter algicola TaxID=2614809 RepID=A0ABX2IUS4_9RHOB|nr:glycosyltransferase [Sulfitobacter algicola]NSX53798.1 glycosyltransferase [Sulfitobacter algicola]